jgi:uncharacterized protein (TIGR02594 family)
MTPAQLYQTHLKKLGFYRGKIDGEFGPLSLAAAFAHHGAVPPWMYVAAQELGVSEILGRRHNPRIVMYHQSVTLAAKTDEIAWCASFVDWCLNKAGYAGTNSAAAATYDKFGLALEEPRVGAIVTFPTKTGSRRHVAFVAGYHERFIFHLGGNQSNKVNVQYNLRTNAAALRWPTKKLT